MTLSDRDVYVLVLAPYNAQIAKIKDQLANRYSHAQKRPRVLTVDASQGTEAECVIISLCKNFGTPGFLRFKRRVNVMTSRARQMVSYVSRWSHIQSDTLQDSSPTLFRMLGHYSKHVPSFVIKPPSRLACR
ncbi:hypothetical protein ASPACDRAFT_127593 [Aspergillus aculeatus ATCC 16872]|uniref:DNA2/NAM7 helicase-like C-terminal domain-containing protein n=1 Tax=Aspergillus aculeatus (strain ATCC 16872 / CBS 172.66 / WB 5094) TaxID=690307 RepID=A0A1L9WFY8_ASPA1|nr:uncharacterized protein ASPACDRAFT_127593 [Aspergillus aculeatus ATCC 16872]OJJ95088.1 hypothetical protein ASPACDRAFT_127593 [Aspergillus aculeatus ATCC 16872]